MINILLVCSAGMSTSLLVSKMEKVAKEKGIECNIQAEAFTDIQRFQGKVDVVLVGPQIRYALDKIKTALPDINVEVIDMRVYGLADGEKALDHAMSLLKKQFA